MPGQAAWPCLCASNLKRSETVPQKFLPENHGSSSLLTLSVAAGVAFTKIQYGLNLQPANFWKSVKDRARPFGDLRHKLWWDNLDAMYFVGYALWNYLTTPFLLLQQDMQIDAMGKWQEGNEVWHRLRVLFPGTVPTHCREQIFYFDDDLLLRRHDYTAEVFGKWAKAAHYCTAHRQFGGFLFPTRRTVWPRNKFGFANRFITLVHIEIDDIDLYLHDED